MEHPDLAHLGKALTAFGDGYADCQAHKGDPVHLQAVVQEISDLARGTPFPDAVRLGAIMASLMMDQIPKTEQQFRVFVEADSFRPHHASYALYYLGTHAMGEDPARSRVFFAQAVRDYPWGAAAPLCWLELAYLSCNEEDRIAIFKRLMKEPPATTPSLRFRTGEEARSEATRAIAAHYQAQKEWEKSLAAWQAWVPKSWCGTCLDGMNVERESSMGRCCEELGHLKEAMAHYWNVAPVDGESAKRLRALCQKEGMLDTLTKMIAEKREKLRKEGEQAPEMFPGLKWLEDSLH